MEAIIFDLDGVLVDSEPLHYRVTNALLADYGATMSWEEFLPIIGTTVSPWDVLKERPGLPATRQELSRRFWEEIEQCVTSRELEPLPGAQRALDWARQGGFRLGLASSSRRSYVEAILAALDLEQAFDAVVCREDVVNGKPDPEPFLETARRLGVPPAACLVIEDSPAGITAARNAGMSVVGVRTPYMSDSQLREANEILETLEELPSRAVALLGIG